MQPFEINHVSERVAPFVVEIYGKLILFSMIDVKIQVHFCDNMLIALNFLIHLFDQQS
jgi:hypothetical protein